MRPILRLFAASVLATAAVGCEYITEPAPAWRASISLESTFATVTDFEAGDSVGYSLMPRAGYLVTIPIRFQNNTDSTLWYGFCPTFSLADESHNAPLPDKCASALTTPLQIGPRETISTTIAIAACDVPEADFHTVAAHSCFYRWDREGFDGRFRLYTVVSTDGSFPSWQTIRSPAFELKKLSASLH